VSWGWVGTIFVGALAFLFGRIFAQSERVLDQKRKVYEDFLRLCPAPNEAHCETEFDSIEMQRSIGLVSLYGSAEVATSAANYFKVFANGQELLTGVKEAGHPEFIIVMTAYNRMIWKMRTNVMAWSVFAPAKKQQKFNADIPLERVK
jgi:hypothetical protein